MIDKVIAKSLADLGGFPRKCRREARTSWNTASAGRGSRIALSDAELDNDTWLLKRFLDHCR